VEASPWQGLGENVRIKVPYDLSPTELVIVSGYAKDEATFKKNSRPHRLKILVNDQSEAYIDLADTRAPQRLELSPRTLLSKTPLKANDWIQLRIISVYPGEKYQYTGISELRFLRPPAPAAGK